MVWFDVATCINLLFCLAARNIYCRKSPLYMCACVGVKNCVFVPVYYGSLAGESIF